MKKTITILGREFTVSHHGTESGQAVYRLDAPRLAYITVRRKDSMMFLASLKNHNTYDITLSDATGELTFVKGRWN